MPAWGFEIVRREQCIEKTGKPPIRGRWGDINKGDDQGKVYRSRYVAMEIRKLHGGSDREGLFAAMPPLEALKLILSLTVSRPDQQGAHPHKLMFIDISKAYLHADVINENLFVELPQEMNQVGRCGRL